MADEMVTISAEEYEKLKAAKVGKQLSLKVSEKGAVSLYGLRRFPVTLYADEWALVFEKKQGILDFISAHTSELSAKK